MSRKKEKAQTQGKRKDFKFLLLVLLFLGISTQKVNSADELGNIEEKVFHQSYKNESQEERISMLENFLFGKEFKKDPAESRIKKITDAITSKKEKEQTVEVTAPEKIEIKDPVPAENPLKEGVLSAVNRIEIKLFNKTFPDYPFQARISALEERVLSGEEIATNRTKPLMERVTVLLHKAGIENNQKSETIKTYSVDPKTNFLINEQTREIVRDQAGSKIYVRKELPPSPETYSLQQQALPQGFPSPYPNNFPANPYGNLNNPYGALQQNPYGNQQLNPFGNNQQIPYELFLNPNNFDIGGQDSQDQ